MGVRTYNYNLPGWTAVLGLSGCLVLEAIASTAQQGTFLATPQGGFVSSDELAETAADFPGHELPLQTADYHGSVELYRQTIAALEDEHGVYDNRLVQQVMGLGLAQQTQGHNDDAVLSFKRALHLSRVNEGLHSLAQAPILRHLIASYEAQDDWESANHRQASLYALQRRHFGYSDARLLQPIVTMIEWHMDAYALGTSADPGIHLLQARALNEQAISIIEENFRGDDVRLSEALYRQAQTNYQLAVLQSAHATGVLAAPGRQADVVFSESDVQKTVFSLNPFSEGKRALSRRVELIAANPEIPSRKKLRAMVQLGDWYFMFNKRDSAIKIYRRAQDQFSDDEAARDDLQNYFGKPHVLSFYTSPKERLAESDKTGYVDAIFDITPSGRAKGIQIIDSNPPDVMDLRVQRSIKATRYRPRFVEGQPVATKGVSYRHVFEVQPET